jgi:hypothetical protein
MTSYIEAVEKLIDQQDEKSIRIRELEAKVKLLEKVEMYLKTSYPDKSGSYFICGEGGVKDNNGLPERLHVCPAYGVDWMQIYTRTERTTGPEW